MLVLLVMLGVEVAMAFSPMPVPGYLSAMKVRGASSCAAVRPPRAASAHAQPLGLRMAATSLGAVEGLKGDLMTLLSVGSGLKGAAGLFLPFLQVSCDYMQALLILLPIAVLVFVLASVPCFLFVGFFRLHEGLLNSSSDRFL